MSDSQRADSGKVTIVLADEDALRRDGLAAVLDGAGRFRVVSQCGDGETALERIREIRPDVAVVDLNLPRVHGIELVRRIREESLGVKIVILSGTSDDEIVREVVRAGADGYLLKNGPARHLIDAILYVQDGGQYFSPQLRRDGLDRHLLEEKPRPRPEARRRALEPDDFRTDEAEDSADRDSEEPASAAGERQTRSSRDARFARSRKPGRRTSEPQRFRERLREEADTSHLGDRDYEILSMMADGIRPILDRLDEIEGRVVQMETGDAPVPSDPRGWLNNQMADTFADSTSRGVAVSRTVQDLEARLPRMIEEAVTSRFHHMAEKLQQEIEDTHIRTLETFVKNIQVKLVQRVSKLEVDMSKQAEAVHQLREYTQRTEDNLSRLLTGVDRLAQELPKRLAAPEADAPAPGKTKKPRSRFPRKLIGGILSGLVAVALAFAIVPKMSRKKSPAPAAAAAQPLLDSTPESSASTAAPPLAEPDNAQRGKPSGAGNADLETKMQAAQKYSDQKEYTTAEDIYKQVLKTEPNNVEALKGLASVLYREDKIEESTSVLDRIPK